MFVLYPQKKSLGLSETIDGFQLNKVNNSDCKKIFKSMVQLCIK